MGKMLGGGTFSRSCEGKNFDRKEFCVFISQIERLGDTSDENTRSHIIVICESYPSTSPST